MVDFKKDFKALYQPKTTPSIVEVPEMVFIAVDGRGNPNTSEEYAAAVGLVFNLSYTIKMSNKPMLEYVVAPLECLWTLDNAAAFKGGGRALSDSGKDRLRWTVMIRQPDFVTGEVLAAAKTALAKKKRGMDLSPARIEKFTEGLCVQVLHTGPYDTEAAAIAALKTCAAENGYAIDMHGSRRHHEIYLLDPRKTAPERLKTVIRRPVKQV